MKTNKPKPKTDPKEKSDQKEKKPKTVNDRFPVVCIGASAGGLEALDLFMSKVPTESGLAYVVIQHLDPTQKGMLPELLQRTTKMKVIQAKDRLAVKPNNVYVIPPNKSMSILRGKLHLFEPLETRGMRLPINFFLNSLAEDLKEHAIGIILSGMGSDGSIGLRAIKERNGLVLVQTPSTAKFDSMPKSAMDSVLADIVAPPEELPAKLLEFLKRVPLDTSDTDIAIKDKSSLEKIIILLRTYTGNDFSSYKKNTMYRRIERRMGIHKIDKIASYVHFLQENRSEGDILFKELLIGVTHFFRDKEVWKKMREAIIPGLITKMKEDRSLRVWVPGCSTGEEAYSLAIMFKETMARVAPHGSMDIQIFATDLDNDAIQKARKGIFPSNIEAEITPATLKRYFVQTDEGYRVNTSIREMVIFAQHNITMHPPFTKIDLISCRNLLIYMDSDLQKKLIRLFYFSLVPNGVLLLGSSETLGTQNHLFSTLDTRLKIYKRENVALTMDLFDFPTIVSQRKENKQEETLPASNAHNLQSLADRLLLEQFSPVGVLVNENGDILYTSGRTGKYLEPAVGKANLNIFAMLREGLNHEFAVAFRKAIANKELVTLPHVKIGFNGNSQSVDVKIQWLDKPDPLRKTIMITFSEAVMPPEVPKTKSGKKDLHQLKQSVLEEELRRSREEMQGTLEEMQTSQEELKSTNEELQSANEELTSSKEEMQSLNEELQTVNAELQSKVDDYSKVNNDMKNLLNSTDIATLFLDKELNIRRFTNQATKIFKLIKSDIGRLFTDQTSDLVYPDLAADAEEVLKSLMFIEKQIPTKNGRWFSIRIMPYRTYDDRIDGLVITFINITDLKQLEFGLHENAQLHNLFLKHSSDIFMKLSKQGVILEFNHQAEEFFGINREKALNQEAIRFLVPEKEQKKVHSQLNKLMSEGKEGSFKTVVLTAGNTMPVVEWFVYMLNNKENTIEAMMIIIKNTGNDKR